MLPLQMLVAIAKLKNMIVWIFSMFISLFVELGYVALYLQSIFVWVIASSGFNEVTHIQAKKADKHERAVNLDERVTTTDTWMATYKDKHTKLTEGRSPQRSETFQSGVILYSLSAWVESFTNVISRVEAPFVINFQLWSWRPLPLIGGHARRWPLPSILLTAA